MFPSYVGAYLIRTKGERKENKKRRKNILKKIVNLEG